MTMAGMNRRFSRRSILGGSVVLAGGAILAACSPAAPPTNTPAPAKPAATTAPAAAATTAPAAAASSAPAAGGATTPAAGATTAAGAATKPAAAATTAPASGATAAPAAAAQTGGQVVTLRIHDWAQDPDNTFYGPLFAKFEQEHPGIKLQKEWFPRDDLHTKELQLAATGQIGDTVRYDVAVKGPELRNKGVVQSLTPFIQKDTKWAQNDQKQFFPGNIANYTAQGQQWGYPVVGHPGNIQYYINTDMAAKVGAKLPDESTKWHWTFDQAMEIFGKGTQKGSDGRVSIYGTSPGLGNEGVVGVLRAFGSNVYSDDGTKCLIGNDGAIAGIQWLADQFNKNKVALPLDAGGKQVDVLSVFPTGKLMNFVSTSSQPGNLHRLIGEGKPNNFKWMILPPPTVKIDDKFPTQISSDGYGMSKQTKYPDQAWEVVKLYASKEHGLGRNLAGLGSPGSRYDVWTDDAFRKNAPELTLIYDTLLNPDKAPPALPWNNPANGRYNEADTAMNNALVDIWTGAKQPKDVLPDLQKTMQAIMDKPPV